jgi:trimeric autotransporter adhesin
MLRLERLHQAVVGLFGFSLAVAVGCGDGAGPAASVHGTAAAGFSDGRASVVQITPPSALVEEGAVTTLRCSAADTRGVAVSSSRSWTISNVNVATISPTGAIAAQHSGNAVASCTVDGTTATATITVVQSPVAFLEVTPGAGILVVGKSLQLVGTPLDSNGAVVASHQVQWTSADSSIASVSASGTVVGKVEGTANVVAVSGGKATFAKINVAKTPPAPVGSVSIKVDDATLNVGQLTHAQATTADVNGQVATGRSIAWSVSAPSVISAVSTSGDKANVTGRGPGSAVLTATSEGKSASVTIAVGMAPVQSVVVNLAATSILPGQTTQATATVKDALGNVLTGRTVTWSSLDPSIATVSPVGVIAGVSTGAVVIRATSESQTGDGSETVGTAPVATVQVNFGASTLAPGQTTQASAVARDASGNVLTGRSVAWSTLTPTIAMVSTTGVVTAVAAGPATIRATVETKIGDGPLTVSAPVPVQATTAGVVVTIDSSTLAPGHAAQAKAVAKDAQGNVLTGKTVSWTSSNAAVASVSSTNGVVTAVSAGKVTIQGTVDSVSNSAALTVNVPSLVAGTTASVVVTIDSSTLAPGHTAQARAVAKDAQGNVLTGKIVSWLSSNAAVANVSSSTGIVTAVSAGMVTISGTVDGVSNSAALTVNLPSTLTAPAPAGEPSYNSTTGAFIFQDSMDGYTSAHDMWLGHLANNPGIHFEQTDFGEDPDSTLLISPGRGGSGKALRLVYSGGYQDGHSWTLRNGPALPDTTTHFFSYWGRVTVAGPMPFNGMPVKWFMAWHATNRVEWDTHDYSPCNVYPTTGAHTFWQVYDNGPSACQGNQPIGPYPDDVFNGQWHRFTYQYRPNTTAGSRDGVARMWLDGIKVVDVSAAACGTTPPGGYKTWCGTDDIDALNTAGIIGYLQWGSTLTKDTPPFTIDIDDFIWWRSK